MIEIEKDINVSIGVGEVKEVKIKDFYNNISSDGMFEIETIGGFKPIGDIYKKLNKKMFYLTLENGLSLKGSSDHLVKVDTSKQVDEDINDNVEFIDGDIWIRMGNISEKDIIMTNIGSSKVSKIVFLGKDDTYDLEVLSIDHSYISNGIISHNTGKSAIAEGLALRIIEKKVSRVLFGKRIVTLDLGSIVAGTKYRGQFEERIKSLMDELSKNKDVILFIDEMHTIIGAGGSSGSLDASNMFKPALARGELQCIGATTLDEYRQHIEKDGALERRFQKVIIEPTSVDDTLVILQNIKDKYEDHHNVSYTDDALKACVQLTDRYMSDRHLPDKAIDALDETGSRVHIININVPKNIENIEKKIDEIKKEKNNVVKSQNYEKAAKLRDVEKQLKDELESAKIIWEKDLDNNRIDVTEEDVSEVVSMMTGIPVTRISENEGIKLGKLDEDIKNLVIGQDDAVDKVVRAIKRNRSGLKDPNSPIGTFIFLGNTGCGKTQLAKVMANKLFEGTDSLIRIDMSEYMEKFSVSRLIGAPPGYVGHDEGGQLTEAVRRKPYSIILLDEIEKAHPDVFNLLLQLLDEGTLTDSLGRKISFKNTIVIMTSNIGSRQLKDFGTGVGFSTSSAESNKHNNDKGIIEKALKKAFAPEFLNRIDDVIFFENLTKDNISDIIDIELNILRDRVDGLGYKIKFSKSAREFILDKGFSVDYGARPLKRAIQKYIEDPVAEEMIADTTLREGSIISISTKGRGDKREIKVVITTKKEEE